jgi:DnaK suppressor protein
MPPEDGTDSEEQTMDEDQARVLLRSDRARTERLLAEVTGEGQADRAAADEPGDMSDSAEPLTEQGTDDSIAAELQRHLEAIDRAEMRLDAGTYGYSVRSGDPIPDDRLEADPTAELTVEESSRVR